jgi:hypothetical protein
VFLRRAFLNGWRTAGANCFFVCSKIRTTGPRPTGRSRPSFACRTRTPARCSFRPTSAWPRTRGPCSWRSGVSLALRYQPFLAEAYKAAYDLDPGLRYLLGGLDRSAYDALLRRAIVGDHDPENVVLLEVQPRTQKTLPDFV